MTEELKNKIEEDAFKYARTQYLDDLTDQDVLDSNEYMCYKAGISFFRNNIWHNLDEKPNFPCDLLCYYTNNAVFFYRFDERGRSDDGLHHFHSIENCQWAYVEDFLPDKN